MNKGAIRNFAMGARKQLLDAVKQRAFAYEITETDEPKVGLTTVGGRLLSGEEKRKRDRLVKEIQQKGYEQVMEEGAYTWFNRFIALRYMEVNGFLPGKIRVFTDPTGGFHPEILKEALSLELPGLEGEKVRDLIDKQDTETLYQYLLITLCNALTRVMPDLFRKISDWTELLFPERILRGDSVIGNMISMIDAEDFLESVEIIGWAYQFYITEKREAVVDPLHGTVIQKDDIPAATQLFTTDWVVRYILDNSLGRYWLERHPESKLADKLTYLILPRDGQLPYVEDPVLPEELKILDPCVGSGHFLSYAFDILMDIYVECGWSQRDAARSILEKNLYGLDIDHRAVQLACFSVIMKARKYCRKILSEPVELHILSINDGDFISDSYLEYFSSQEDLKQAIDHLGKTFVNGREYGSMISVTDMDYGDLYDRVKALTETVAMDIFSMDHRRTTEEQLLPLIRQAQILGQKYDVVATNPPYMNKYSPLLNAFLKKHFAEYKGDLFSVFMVRNFGFCKEGGYSGFMTPNVWMFIKSYEALRNFILREKSITTLIQMAKGAFFKEATVDVCAFVLSNKVHEGKGMYIRLEDFKGDMDVQKEKVLAALEDRSCGYVFEGDQRDFSRIPGAPIAYWVGNALLKAFAGGDLYKVADVQEGLKTGDNERFIRFWQEVDFTKTYMHSTEHYKWVHHTKGGEFRKWYGNQNAVLNYEDNGRELRDFKGSSLTGVQNYFKENISYSRITSAETSFRYTPEGSIPNMAGLAVYAHEELYALLGWLNTKVVCTILSITNPTLNFPPGTVGKIPVVFEEIDTQSVSRVAKENVELSKADWDSFEASWEFQKHPLV